MFHAQYLFHGDEVYSPWMARQGDNFYLVAELVAQQTAWLKIEVFHKNFEDPGPGTAATVDTLQIATPGVDGREFTDLKELVRLKLSTRNGTASGHRILFRTFPPTWYDAVAT